jgi:ATP-dependent Clp protease adaptor protein ClpS
MAENQPATTVDKAKPKPHRPTEALPPYNVVLLNDDDHTYEYVIEMLGKIFGYDRNKADRMAEEVDRKGRVILLTTHRERAELKRDQVGGYGPDFRMETSRGSMSAIVEPAEG